MTHWQIFALDIIQVVHNGGFDHLILDRETSSLDNQLCFGGDSCCGLPLLNSSIYLCAYLKISGDKMSGLSVVVVGDSKCGKTQLINRFANAAFEQVGFAS